MTAIFVLKCGICRTSENSQGGRLCTPSSCCKAAV